MSDTKFTPGPWWAAIGKDQPVPYYRGLVAVLSSDPYISICTGETGDQSGRTCGGDEWEANAALIAAAPDLYEAAETELNALLFARTLLAEYERQVSGDTFNSPVINSAIDDARAALAKARGEK